MTLRLPTRLSLVTSLAALIAACASSPETPSEPAPSGSSQASGGAQWEVDLDLPTPFAQVATGTFHSCSLMMDGTVDCWGIEATVEPPDDRYAYGQALPPRQTFDQIAAGAFHTCGIRPDSRQVQCWGRDDFGQASPPDGPFEHISGGGYHTCGLRPDGRVDCWGLGQDGEADELDGRAIQPSGPPDSEGSFGFDAIDGESRWIDRPIDADQSVAPDGTFAEISAGTYHTCARRPDGHVDCWGRGGDGGAADPPDTRFQTLDAGLQTTCGITRDGSVDCWGEVPFDLEHFLYEDQEAVALTLGHHHACARAAEGGVACEGPLDRHFDAYSSPITTLASGALHTCAVDDHGRLACHGIGTGEGKPTGGDFGQSDNPDLSRYMFLSVGAHQACLQSSVYAPPEYGGRSDFRPGSDLRCWRGNTRAASEFEAWFQSDDNLTADGRKRNWPGRVKVGGRTTCGGVRNDLGLDNVTCWKSQKPTSTKTEPEFMFLRPSDSEAAGFPLYTLKDFDVGGAHRCIQGSEDSRSKYYCRGKWTEPGVWEGPGDFDQAAEPARSPGDPDLLLLGEYHSLSSDTGRGDLVWGDVTVDRFDRHGADISRVVQGRHHGCWLNDDMPHCSGIGADPDVDEGPEDFDQAAPPDVPMRDLAAGRRYSCGIRRADDRVVCWGDNSHGQLDAPDRAFDRIAAAQLPPSAAGYAWTCGVTLDHDVLCWGPRPDNLSEPSDTENVGRPRVERLGPITHLSAGTLHTCATDRTGYTACWGIDSYRQLSVPRGERFRTVVSGMNFNCGLRDDATIGCWGRDVTRSNPMGMGFGDFSRDSPLEPPSGRFRRLAASRLHACAITLDGRVRCWGFNDHNQRAAPAGGDFQDLALGFRFSCGLHADGRVECWGGQEADRRRDDDEAENRPTPHLPDPPEMHFASIAGGKGRVCGIPLDEEGIVCWGETVGSAPESGTFQSVTLGESHGCGLRTDGTIDCWGQPDPDEDFQQTEPPDGSFRQITAGADHTCARPTDGPPVCWGLGTRLRTHEGEFDYNQGVTPSGTVEGVAPGR